MAEYPRLFIDSDGVERGYYVYAHRNCETKQIFYVGKGKEERAWKDDRSAAWKDYVKGAGGKFDVILLHRDLTEDEAINLERIEIEANGGPRSRGGSLINWIPGEAGEGFGVAATISVSGWGTKKEDDPESYEIGRQCLELQYAARKFRNLTKTEKDNLEASYIAAVQETYDQIAGFIDGVQDMLFRLRESGKDVSYDVPFLMQKAYLQNFRVVELCYKIRKRKMKWMDFCIAVDTEILSLDSSIRKEERDGICVQEELVLCKLFSEAQIDWSYCYASGTFAEAEYASEEHWINYKFPPGKSYDDSFRLYVESVRMVEGDAAADVAIQIRKALEQAANAKCP